MQHANLSDLPLSWKRSTVHSPTFKSVDLGNLQWMSLGKLPQNFNFDELYNNLPAASLKNPFLRGCNQSLVHSLKKFGFKSFYIGQEAILNLSQNPFTKKSLRTLVRRGLRHGHIIEIPFNAENEHKIKQLKAESPYGKRPQLKHLFRTEFEPDMRGFIFEDKQQDWLAAITISQIHSQKMQTELFVKKEKSPVGIMEALIQHIHKTLQMEQVKYWSLGEVPFVDDKSHKSVKERFAGVVGRSLKAAYKYQSLYRFKNKFNPDWQPVFLCAKSENWFRILMQMFIKSNFLRLAIWKFGQVKI